MRVLVSSSGEDCKNTLIVSVIPFSLFEYLTKSFKEVSVDDLKGLLHQQSDVKKMLQYKAAEFKDLLAGVDSELETPSSEEPSEGLPD